jgi:hypothetical protein
MKSKYLAGLMIFIFIFANSPEALALKPEELSPPRIRSPLYQGADVIEVMGFTANAEISIYKDGNPNPIGGGKCWFSKCTFAVSELTTGNIIRATQTVDGITSFKTRDEHAVTVEKIPQKFLDPKYNNERLIPPVVDSDLYACQRVVPVSDVVEGALVQVYSLPDLNNPIGKEKTPWNYARPVTPELTEDQKIVANQTLLFPQPSDTSPEVRVKAKPEKSKIKQPDIKDASLVVGSNAIEVNNLFIGATVEIYYKQGDIRQSIGRNLAKWENTIFQVEPLKAEWADCPDCIKADQSLCEMTVTGAGKPVKSSLDRPKIVGPVCAGSIELTVCNTVINSTLILYREGPPLEQIGQQGADDECTTIALGDNKNLQNKDVIYVIQQVGKLKSESVHVQVVDKSQPAFEIRNGKYCDPCAGEDYGPIYDRNSLTPANGPLFRAAMCGAEAAKVDIYAPSGALIEKITLEELKGKKGYFEGSWDWSKIGWKTYQDIPPGKYKATFEIWPTALGTKVEKYFYLATQGCVELEVLCAHNKYRAQINSENPGIQPLDPLTWSQTLADNAQKCAASYTSNDTCAHKCQRGSEGENLSCGTSAYAVAIDDWGSEKKCFKYGIFPDTYNGQCDLDPYCKEYKDWHCSGHYSQIIWRNTKQVGCGTANGWTVCRYLSHGNVHGDKPY